LQTCTSQDLAFNMKEWEHQANGFREYVKRIVASPSRSFFVVCLSFIGGVVLAAFLNRPIFEIPFWIFANLFLFAAEFVPYTSDFVPANSEE